MSRIFMIGDSHIGLGFPNKSDNWKKVHIEYFEEFLLPTLEKEVIEGDIVVHLGDLFDNRNVIPIDLLNYGMEIVERISKIAPLHILVGNHDCWHRSSSEINTIRPFKWIPNVFIYDKTTKIEFCDKNLLMMPFIEKKAEQVDLIKNNTDCHYLFCHSDLNGAKMHLTSVAHKNLDKIDVDEFNNFIKVYSGHIHIVQAEKNFTFVGNNFEMDRNDRDNQKGIFILDVINNSESFIANNISPKFKRVFIMTERDIDKLDSVSTKDYIDLFISNSLLINNRKLRRKLEILLETGNFASVEYIDDINSTDEETNENIKQALVNENSQDESFKAGIQLEYKEVIREYILSQSYGSEKVKNGILQEYNEIVRVYDEEYKK